MDPRDEPEPDFTTVAPYDSIVKRMADLGDQEAGIELARETWLAIQEERGRAWEEAQGEQGRRSPVSPSPSHTPLPPPPERRRNTEQQRRVSPSQQAPGRQRFATPDRLRRSPQDRRDQTPGERLRRRSPEKSPSGDDVDDEGREEVEAGAEEAKPAFSAKIVKGQTVDSETTYQPDPKVVASLASGKFVPLWHFIDRNCKNAAMRMAVAGGDGLTVKVDGKSLNVSAEAFPYSSKGALKDDQLSYNDFHHAQPLLIAKMYESRQYSAELIEGLIDMFHALDRHAIRKKDFGDLAVQRYASEVRIEWHAKMKEREIFDIAEIGEDRLRGIYQDILDEKRKDT